MKRKNQNDIVIPQSGRRRFYGHGIPGVELDELVGKLIVVEGADGSGRSTQIARLVEWLETTGHATVQVGLKRSTLVSEELEKAQEGNILSRTTLSLFYATDFADQLEHKIVPALHAGYVVLADRYIYTLMARSTVRGISRSWSHGLFGFAIKPELVFYLDVPPEELFHRVFEKYGSLDYYESGADMGLSDNLFESFVLYQRKMAREFKAMERTYGLVRINGGRPIAEVNADLQARIDSYIASQF
jgi:dTMP kinase